MNDVEELAQIFPTTQEYFSKFSFQNIVKRNIFWGGVVAKIFLIRRRSLSLFPLRNQKKIFCVYIFK